MSWRRLFHALFLCVFITSVQGQDTRSGSFSVHVAPLSAFDPHPRYRTGVQMDLHRWSFLVDAGFGSSVTNKWRLSDHWQHSYSAFEIRPECRMVLFNFWGERLYLGLEAFYLRTEAKVIDDYFEQGDGTIVHYTSSEFRKTKAGANLKMGLQVTFPSGWVLDFYYGAGLRSKEISYSHTQPVIGPDLQKHGDSILKPHFHREGKNFGLSGALGIRVGVVIQEW